MFEISTCCLGEAALPKPFNIRCSTFDVRRSFDMLLRDAFEVFDLHDLCEGAADAAGRSTDCFLLGKEESFLRLCPRYFCLIDH